MITSALVVSVLAAPTICAQLQPSADNFSLPGASAPPAAAGNSTDEPGDLLDLDIEQLRKTTVAPAFDEVVTSVSRQESTVGQSPGAVFVVTSEMIRRSGARSVPEALRLVPGLQVARLDMNKWVISSRGFGEQFANKLLVQVDGRVVYTPIFAGVYWDVQDMLLEDIERIEVIRGPGATVWGANAVNGVINIITKSAEQTVGLYATGGGGNVETGFGGARIGGCALDGDLHWRISSKLSDRSAGFRAGQPTFDGAQNQWFGSRVDWTPTSCDQLTLSGALYESNFGDALEQSGVVFPNGPQHASGGHVLARWTRELGESRNWALQMYWDRSKREVFLPDQQVDIFDVDFQYSFPINTIHQVIWGLGYRRYHDQITPSPPPIPGTVIPAQRSYYLYGGFIQDRMTLLEDELYFTLGTKLEQNSFTGFEVQPSARLLWTPKESVALWSSVSRAVRTPSRVDHDLSLFSGGLLVLGNRAFVSEELMAYEAGVRSQPVEWFSWELATFFNVYENLGGFDLIGPTLVTANNKRGQTYGFELSGTLDVSDCWRLTGYYTFLRTALDVGPLSYQTASEIEGTSPRNQIQLFSSWDLAKHTELDVITRYVDVLPARATGSYITMDLRLARRLGRGIEFSIVGQNLLSPAHKEYDGGFWGQFTEVQRGVYGQFTWRY